jgi:transcriptional regulator with XRE-family HTH domain
VKKRQSSPVDSSYGRAVRETRERVGYSLREVARLAEIHPTYLSKIELGHLPPPSPEVQKRIDGVLKSLLMQLVRCKKQGLVSLESDVFEHELLLIDALVSEHVHQRKFRDPLLQLLRRLVKQLETDEISK